MWRVIVLELSAEGVPNLLTVVEETRLMATAVLDGLKDAVNKRGGSILYTHTLPVGDAGECCREEKVLR